MYNRICSLFSFGPYLMGIPSTATTLIRCSEAGDGEIANWSRSLLQCIPLVDSGLIAGQSLSFYTKSQLQDPVFLTLLLDTFAGGRTGMRDQPLNVQQCAVLVVILALLIIGCMCSRNWDE